MKSKIIKRFAGIVAFLMLATQITVPAYATNSTTTNDPTPTLTSAEEDDSSVAEEEEEEEEVELSEDVDEDNVVDVLSDDLDDEEDDDDAEDLVEQAAEEVADSLEGESEDDIESALDDLEEEIQDKIDELNDEITQNPTKKAKLLKKIEHLKKLLMKLRVRLLEKNAKLASKIKGIKNPRAVFEMRWGNLNQTRRRCLGITANDLTENSDGTTTVPAKCQDLKNKVDYTGKVSVDVGTLKVRKEVLFEENDSVTTDSGSSIEFTSVIAGHWDGLIVEYVPDSTSTVKKNEVMFTVSLGDLDQTYKGSELLGTKKIGNNHMVQFRPLARVLPSLSATNANNLLNDKLKIEDKVNKLRNKLQRLQLLNKGGEGTDDLEDVIDDVEEYNFDDTSADEVEDAIDDALEELDDNATEDEIEDAADDLEEEVEKIKVKAKGLKYNKNLIPFKDTDDNEWYTHYVASVKNRGIFSGYEDAAGNELGEFRPGNNITVAEILKVGLETAKEGKAKGKTPKLRAAVNHWAKEYVAKAEELGLDLVSGSADLNRPATRGEVIRMMLEVLGLVPGQISKVDFSDVSTSHPHAAFIQKAKELGLVSGDDVAGTFRPNDPINRAEASKIADLVFQIIYGGSETIGGDEPWE